MSAYLRFAIQHHGNVPFDLMTSGTRDAPASLWLDPARIKGDDATAALRAREAIARMNDVPTSEVMLTAGAAHAIWLACASVVGRGEDVLVEHPHYEPLRTSAELVGGTVRTFAALGPEPPRDLPSRVARALRPDTRLVVLSNLHNPTGQRRSDDDLRAIASVLATRGAYLLVDEIYAPFDALSYEAGIASARKLGDNVLAVSSLTKTLGLGQHRIGWLLAREEVIDRAVDAMLSSVGFLPHSHAEIACLALENLGALATRALVNLPEKRALVESFVRSLPDLSWSAPASGLFGFAWYEDRRDLTDALLAAPKSEGVIVAPGFYFGVPSGFRISWSNTRELIAPGLERLARVLGGPQAAPPAR